MSEPVQETLLTTIADNVAESFFTDGGASSKNVMTAEEDPKDPKEPKEPKIKNKGFESPQFSFSADNLIGDLLEKPEDNTPSPVVTPKKIEDTPTSTEPQSSGDYGFLIEKGVLAGYEDDSPIKTPEELEKLISENKKVWESEAQKKALDTEFGSLPDEVKLVVEYAKNGGDNFRALFGLLSKNQELRSYDIEKAEDQRAIIRDYYNAQNWSEDEIEEEIVSLVESEKLKTHANKLKPKLDKINDEFIAEQTAQQAEIKKQREDMQKFFVGNVVEAVKKGKLGEIQLSKEEQQDIYNALVRESYQSLGGKTNRLGALLDKIQYIEPDYELLAEVTLLLSNKEEYHKKIREAANTQVSATTVKKIKIDQNKQKIGTEYNAEKDTKKLPKLGSGFINPYE